MLDDFEHLIAAGSPIAQILQATVTLKFGPVIPRSVRLAEAPSHGKPIVTYDLRSRGAESYIQLAKEILDRDHANRQSAQSVG